MAAPLVAGQCAHQSETQRTYFADETLGWARVMMAWFCARMTVVFVAALD